MPKKAKGNLADIFPDEDEEEDPLKVKRHLTEITQFEQVRFFRTEKFYSKAELHQFTLQNKKPNKFYEMPIRGLGIKPKKFSTTGIPSVDTDTVQELVGGHLEKELLEKKDPEFILDLKNALQCWLEMKRIETLMTTFIVSLIQAVNPKGK